MRSLDEEKKKSRNFKNGPAAGRWTWPLRSRPLRAARVIRRAIGGMMQFPKGSQRLR